MLERTDAVTNQVLEPITFVLAHPHCTLLERDQITYFERSSCRVEGGGGVRVRVGIKNGQVCRVSQPACRAMSQPRAQFGITCSSQHTVTLERTNDRSFFNMRELRLSRQCC